MINLGTNDHLPKAGTAPAPDAAGFLVYAKGALSAGNDLAVRNMSSLREAEAWCVRMPTPGSLLRPSPVLPTRPLTLCVFKSHMFC